MYERKYSGLSKYHISCESLDIVCFFKLSIICFQKLFSTEINTLNTTTLHGIKLKVSYIGEIKAINSKKKQNKEKIKR